MDVGCEWFYSPSHLSIGGTTFSNNNLCDINNRATIQASIKQQQQQSNSANQEKQSSALINFNNNSSQQPQQQQVATQPISPQTQLIASLAKPHLKHQQQTSKPRPSNLNINQIRLLNKSFSRCQRQWRHQIDQICQDRQLGERETLDEYDEFGLEDQLLLGGSGSTTSSSTSTCRTEEQGLLDDSGSVNCSEYADIIEEDQHQLHNPYHHLQHQQYYNNKNNTRNNPNASDFFKHIESSYLNNHHKQHNNDDHNNSNKQHQEQQQQLSQTSSSNLKLNFLAKFLGPDHFIDQHQHYRNSPTTTRKSTTSTSPIDTNQQVTMATVRPISPQYQHTLDSAISLARDLASKNMADSGESSPKTPNSPDKKLFNFKFKHYSKSFSDQASANIRDIESSISNDEKQAYELLIGRGPYNSLSSNSSTSSSSYHNRPSSLSSSSSSSSSASSHARSSSYTLHNQSQPFHNQHHNYHGQPHHHNYQHHSYNHRSRPQPFGYGNSGASGSACSGGLHNLGTGTGYSGAGAGANASNTFSAKKSFFM